jgi:hypothetical protein
MCTTPPEETIEHMLFHCPFSQVCWATLNISCQQHGHRLQIIEQAKSQWTRPMFMEIFIIGASSIWKERNSRLFDNKIPDLDSWKRRFTTDLSLLVHRTKEDFHPFITSVLNSI